MTSLRFRNVDASPSDDVTTWPYEAIVTAIERGLVPDWQPLFAEIRRRGEVREIPLLYQTLCLFAEGKLNTAAGAVFAESTRLPLDLTQLVEEEVARR